MSNRQTAFKKATIQDTKLRLALFGVAGSGKTFSSLSIATGMDCGKIAVIDTEFGSASKYADKFDFDVVELGDDQSIKAYINMMHDAASGGYEVLIIDSLTHAWEQLLAEVNRLEKTKYKGNSWAAWSEGTPIQKELVKAILQYPGHVIATMRVKTNWETVNENGKMKPLRIGLSPEQGKGIEYEFDMLMEISPEHNALVIKDRTGFYQDKVIEKPGKEFGKGMGDWINGNKEKIESEKIDKAENFLLQKIRENVESTDEYEHKRILNKINQIALKNHESLSDWLREVTLKNTNYDRLIDTIAQFQPKDDTQGKKSDDASDFVDKEDAEKEGIK